MWSRFWKWWKGELVEVTVVVTRNYIGGFYWWPHTLVQLEDGQRMCVNGLLGEVGDRIKVNTWHLWRY